MPKASNNYMNCYENMSMASNFQDLKKPIFSWSFPSSCELFSSSFSLSFLFSTDNEGVIQCWDVPVICAQHWITGPRVRPSVYPVNNLFFSFSFRWNLDSFNENSYLFLYYGKSPTAKGRIITINDFLFWTSFKSHFYYLNLRSSEIHLFYNLGDFYWHFLEILWLFIFLFLYSFSRRGSPTKE